MLIPTRFTAGAFKRLLKRQQTVRRYDAAGKLQSVAIIDRTFGSIKPVHRSLGEGGRKYAGR